MSANEFIIPAIVGVVTGAVLGLGYFWNLWRTIQRLTAPHPATRALLGYLGRMAGVTAGFVLLARLAGWPAVIGAALSFVAARMVLVRLCGPHSSRGGLDPATVAEDRRAEQAPRE